MQRLTIQIQDYVYFNNDGKEVLAVEMNTQQIRDVLKKLAYYENREEKINRYIGVVDVLISNLEDVIPTALEDDEYRESDLVFDLKYAEKRINLIKERRIDLDK